MKRPRQPGMPRQQCDLLGHARRTPPSLATARMVSAQRRRVQYIVFAGLESGHWRTRRTGQNILGSRSQLSCDVVEPRWRCSPQRCGVWIAYLHTYYSKHKEGNDSK